MKQFDLEATIIHASLQQLVSEYWTELDLRGAREIELFYDEDCIFSVAGRQEYQGRQGVRSFYDRRDALVEAEKDSSRTTRHCHSNFRVHVDGIDLARVDFVMINYSGAGKAPIDHFSGPSMVSDVTMYCRRNKHGRWLIQKFIGLPIFLSGETFAEKVLS